ncbi:TetR/AcrR family transcriptional regulator [Clostridium estertheticum]|uniref:TetR/AcrR family transcriptional regulator n=1 Tax=Clostridium estertheticum TaxID=238834 RepID=A0A7Y3SWF9_9CLOT|nr:TetR/AcrR family transcriptional regulator [Clostridium estertheticum]MBW9172463.1 TetR/AcrR family transcriptional regulator [Clostridium estertheticum]NNU76646.1 TetR/AcrR family transcriptional regulator [Clostridium estertheticum]WBL45385.1 TetR/AcrR family transcriptional regulator [Clostridium estertheticum]WLC73467.1 TetR/AcrR family transcriptional regulator [Clostridium estertheticum]
MPKIYSQEKRQEIREQIMDMGLELIKQYGMRKMSIEQITKKVGIAQGTFYNFFDSKEILVYELANAYQERINQKLEEIIQIKGYLDRESLRELYYGMILKDEDNVYRLLKREDIQTFLTRLPSNCLNKISDTKMQMEKNLRYVSEKKEKYDLDAILNWIQVMNLVVENKDILVETGIEKIVNRMIENMLDEIF